MAVSALVMMMQSQEGVSCVQSHRACDGSECDTSMHHNHRCPLCLEVAHAHTCWSHVLETGFSARANHSCLAGASTVVPHRPS